MGASGGALSGASFSKQWAAWALPLLRERSDGPHVFGGLTFDPARFRTTARNPGAIRSGYTGRLRWSERLTEDGSVRLRDVPMVVDVATAKVRKWLRAGEERLSRPISGIIALESQRNGWPHFHPLLSIEGGLQDGDIAKLGLLWYNANGGNRLEQPGREEHVTAYLAKYLFKEADISDVIIWRINKGA